MSNAILYLRLMYMVMITNNWMGQQNKIYSISCTILNKGTVNDKIWDGRLVHTVLYLDVKYMVCETNPEMKKKTGKRSILELEKENATISSKNVDLKHKMIRKMIGTKQLLFLSYKVVSVKK